MKDCRILILVRGLCGGAALAGLVAAAVLLRLPPAPSHFRRYVSPPLPDGTRYTFLYPLYLDNVRSGWLNGYSVIASVRIDNGEESPTTGDRLRRLLGLPIPLPHRGDVTVVVGAVGPRYMNRPEAQWQGADGSHHTASFVDTRSHMRFLLLHEGQFYPRLFKQDDPVVIRSFRVLPPGAATPSQPR